MSQTMSYARVLLDKFMQTMEGRGELLPGASTRIQKLVPPSPDPGTTFQKALTLLEGDGSCLLTKLGRKAIRQEEPLRFLLSRLPLKDGSIDSLYGQWAANLCEYPIAFQAKVAVNRLAMQGYEMHLADDRSAEIAEDNVYRTYAALERFRECFAGGVNLMELAREWSKDVGHLKHHEACARVASRLRAHAFARDLCVNGQPVVILGSDERFDPLDYDADRRLAIDTKIALQKLAADTAELKKELDESLLVRDLLRLKCQVAEVETDNARQKVLIDSYERDR